MRITVFARILLAALLIAGPLAGSLKPVEACSCKSTEEVLPLSSSAFIGHVVASADWEGRISEDTDRYELRNHVFRVETVVKGDPGPVVVVHSGLVACDLARAVVNGERVGIMVFDDIRGVHEASLCSQADPETLLSVASNLGYTPQLVNAPASPSDIDPERALANAVLPPEPRTHGGGFSTFDRKVTVAAIATGAIVLLLVGRRVFTGSFTR